MNPQILPAQLRDDVPAWAQTVVAFLAEKERRSGSRRTVEGYARMLWPFFDRVGSPDRVTPAHVLAWAHGIGASGREPSSATVGARIACLSSYFRFLIRMSIMTANPCDALERPRSVPSVARGLTAGDISVEGETAFYSYRGKGGKRGRRELPRPAYEALCATLVDAGLSLAEMDPSASLWQAAAGPRGVTGSTFYNRFRRYLRLAGLAPTGLHILRHSAAKLRRDAGASIEASNAIVKASVVGLLAEQKKVDFITLARIAKDREAAMSRYLKDRDARALDGTMARLDIEEAEAREASTTIDAKTALDYLADLPGLWRKTAPERRRNLAEAIFERIEVLGVKEAIITPTPEAEAHGWREAWGDAVLTAHRDGYGRGERSCAVMSDAGAVVRFVRERHAEVEGRSA